jgi:hypothetical protein
MERHSQIIDAKAKNAPGGITMIIHLSQYGVEKYGIANPRIVPMPNSSRTTEIASKMSE